MNAVATFVTGMVITMGIIMLVLRSLNKSLRAASADRHGSAGITTFWLVFTNAILSLVPFALALGGQTATDGWRGAALQIRSQLESSLIGFSVSLAMVGWILGRYALQDPSVSSAK